ncbi:hypothetical protein E2562_021384 [Oryza meyeriana var. granulata]|uniref:Uncharacterized protein n=1 Tax=Oryza meyeriana var. granulata TaxID=110450 RepID=A0A6G1EXJ1_9ORYZ|nr:hypothetical protein E2562_021384 [Oryza meyeriana var. granulata]
MAEAECEVDWVMLDSDNPTDSSDDDLIVALSNSCTIPAASDSDENDEESDVEGDLEEELPRPPPPRPLSGLFYHTVSSTRGLVCVRDETTGSYYVTNPATFRRVRLTRHARIHSAFGDLAVVVTFEEPYLERPTAGEASILMMMMIHSGDLPVLQFSLHQSAVKSQEIGSPCKAWLSIRGWRGTMAQFLNTGVDVDLGVVNRLRRKRRKNESNDKKECKVLV